MVNEDFQKKNNRSAPDPKLEFETIPVRDFRTDFTILQSIINDHD